MKAAGSVMKAAGGVMEVRMIICVYINARLVASRVLLLNVSRGGSAESQTDFDELFCIGAAGPRDGVTKQEAHIQAYLIGFKNQPTDP